MAKALDMTSQPPFLRSALLSVFLYPMFTPCLRVRGKVERGHLASVPIKEGDAKGKEKGREGGKERKKVILRMYACRPNTLLYCVHTA